METHTALLIVLSCLLASMQVVNSITCYECISYEPGSKVSACEDPIDTSSSAVTTCNATQCYKQSAKGKNNAGVSAKAVVRGCSPTGPGTESKADTCTKESFNDSTGKGEATACYCSTDRCNTGHAGRQISTIFLFSVSLFTVLVSLL